MRSVLGRAFALQLAALSLAACASDKARDYGVADSTRGALVVGTKSRMALVSVGVRSIPADAKIAALQLCADCWRKDTVPPAAPAGPIPVVFSLAAGRYAVDVEYVDEHPLTPNTPGGTLTDTFTARPGRAVLFTLGGGWTVTRPGERYPRYGAVWLSRQVLVDRAAFAAAAFLICLPALVAGVYSARFAKRLRGGWKLIAWIPVLPLAGDATWILWDTAHDPTAHNLWPFELVVALVIAFVLAGAIRLGARLFNRPA